MRSSWRNDSAAPASEDELSRAVFLDANVFVYAGSDVSERDLSLAILDGVSAGSLDGVTSVAVIEEVWHVELRGRSIVEAGLAHRSYLAMRPILSLTEQALALALELDLPGIGSMDRLHVATCLLNGIDTIVTADASFDAVDALTRIDPTDADQVAGLLR